MTQRNPKPLPSACEPPPRPNQHTQHHMTQRATYCASFCAHVPNIVAPRGILTMTQRMPAPLRSHPAAHTSQIPCQENSNYDPARGCSSAPHGILIVTRRMVALLLSRHHPTPQTAHEPTKIQNRCRAPPNPLRALTDTRSITRIMTQRATHRASFCARVPNIVVSQILAMTQRMAAPLLSHPAAHTSQIPCQETSSYDPARGCSPPPHGILIVSCSASCSLLNEALQVLELFSRDT